jgi:hypothetical protein
METPNVTNIINKKLSGRNNTWAKIIFYKIKMNYIRLNKKENKKRNQFPYYD